MRTIKKTVALAQRYFGTPSKALTAAQENQTTSPSNNKHLNDPSKLANEFNRQFTPSSNNMPTKTYHSHYVSSPWTKGHHLPYPPFQHLSDSMCSLSPWLTTCIISLLKPNKPLDEGSSFIPISPLSPPAKTLGAVIQETL